MPVGAIGPEYLVHPAVACAEHHAGPHHRDGQRFRVLHRNPPTGELAACDGSSQFG